MTNMKEMFNKYADLMLSVGGNVQKGDNVVINAPLDAADFARILTNKAYDYGARSVSVRWGDEETTRIQYLREDIDTLRDIPDWRVRQSEESVERKCVLISILSENPEAFLGVPAEKIAAAQKALSEKTKKLHDAAMNSEMRWTLAPYAGKKWARVVFPDLPDEKAVEKLWDYIFKTIRLDQPDPIKAWEQHQKMLSRRTEILNDAGIKSLHYKSEIGTDLTVEMPKGYIFEGGAGPNKEGLMFMANIPTEEVFSAPHRDGVSGKVVASMPLIYNGNRIDKFWLMLEKGRIVDFDAKMGKEYLKELIETDEGSHYLGEVALVGYNSPIQNLKTLFYNTLFDENASCHFAIGRAYSSCLKGGTTMTEKQLLDAGLNYSLEHEDFMIGTPKLSIVATLLDGSEMVIFKDGDWAF